MNNKIDLSRKNVYTDLAIESINQCQNKPKITTVRHDNVTINRVVVEKQHEKEIGKKNGIYITIEFDDITNFEDREKIGKYLEDEIFKILKNKNITDEDEGMIIGLGNINSTPDALGPKVINSIVVTRHLFVLNENVKKGIRSVSAISPGVMSQTGIETADYIKSLIIDVKPKFIIIIDALAALSIERVNKTIQMTDTGINPGSGVGNNRKEINEKSLGIPVIAIGVPTVVGSSTIVNETINYLFKHVSYIKSNSGINKLVFNHSKKYIQKIKDLDLNTMEKENLLGLFGTLSDNEKKSLIDEVLTSINYNLIVTPKEIDFIIDKISEVIASSLNNALHRQINHF